MGKKFSFVSVSKTKKYKPKISNMYFFSLKKFSDATNYKYEKDNVGTVTNNTWPYSNNRQTYDWIPNLATSAHHVEGVKQPIPIDTEFEIMEILYSYDVGGQKNQVIRTVIDGKEGFLYTMHRNVEQVEPAPKKIPHKKIPIKGNTNNKVKIVVPELSLMIDAHIHIESNNAAPLTLQWAKLPGILKGYSKSTLNWFSRWLSGLVTAQFAKIGVENTLRIADIYMSEILNNFQIKGRTYWSSLHKKAIVGLKQTHYAVRRFMFDTVHTPSPKAVRRKKTVSQGRMSREKDVFKAFAPYFSGKEIMLMAVALPMDMHFAHYWANFGLPIYIEIDGTYYYFYEYNEYLPYNIDFKEGIKQSNFLVFNKFDFSKHPSGSNLSEKSLLVQTNTTYKHFLKEIPDNERKLYEDYIEEQVPYTESAALKYPYLIIPFYHYDPRRHFDLSKLNNTSDTQDQGYLYTLKNGEYFRKIAKDRNIRGGGGITLPSSRELPETDWWHIWLHPKNTDIRKSVPNPDNVGQNHKVWIPNLGEIEDYEIIQKVQLKWGDASAPDGMGNLISEQINYAGIQARLKKLRFYSGPITGYDSSTTKEAIKKYQKNRSLAITGTADLATRKKLQREELSQAKNNQKALLQHHSFWKTEETRFRKGNRRHGFGRGYINGSKVEYLNVTMDKIIKIMKNDNQKHSTVFDKNIHYGGEGIFWGYKMYTRLGYAPDDFARFPHLHEYYKTCEEKQIPITCHGSAGGMGIADTFINLTEAIKNHANENNSEIKKFWQEKDKILTNNKYPWDISKYKNKSRKDKFLPSFIYVDEHCVHPRNWENVLKKYPKLKLCLAHFSCVDQWQKPLQQTDADAGRTPYWKDWRQELVDLINKYDNLYVDISYFYVEKMKEDKNFLMNLVNDLALMLKTNSKLKERILMGSDWFMVEIEDIAPTSYYLIKFFMLFVTSNVVDYDTWYQFSVLNPLRFLNILKKDNSLDYGLLKKYKDNLIKNIENKKSDKRYLNKILKSSAAKLDEMKINIEKLYKLVSGQSGGGMKIKIRESNKDTFERLKKMWS